MGETKTQGWLLKKTFLSNDDAFVEFFTESYGRVKLSARKLRNSRKRNLEIDFFRLLEIGIFEGRQSKSLHSVATTSLCSLFSQNLEVSEMGFRWIETLQRVLPEEKPTPILFETVSLLLQNVDPQYTLHFDLFFRVVVLNFLGFLPRFDQVRGTCFFDSQNFRFSSKAFPGGTSMSDRARQIIEFLRRSDVTEFFEKKENLPSEYFEEVGDILSDIEEYHLS